MSVEAFRMKNFMAFQDTGWIELRPITLIFGRNSSGKSVIGRALRLLKQSLAADSGSGPFVYATRQGVDVGNFKTIIHTDSGNPDWHKPVLFAFRCQLQGNTLDEVVKRTNQHYQREKLRTILAEKVQDQVEIWLQYECKRDNEPEDGCESPRLTRVEITYPGLVQEQRPPLTIFTAERLDELYSTEDEWWFYSDILHGHEVDPEPVWAHVKIELASGFLPTITAPEVVPESSTASFEDLQFVADLLRELRGTIEQFLRNTDYLGPLRPPPERLFVFDAQRMRDWRNGGLGGYLAYLQGELDESVMEEVNRWLRGVGLCDRARCIAHKFDDRALVASIEIRESEEGEWRNLADVGSGVSQVLPVIVQSLVTNQDSMVFIEQPELHLHPEGQAMLSDLFINCVNQNSSRFILETHSEPLLLRLQRRMAETTHGRLKGVALSENQRRGLEPKRVEVVFIKRIHGKSYVENVKIDNYGQLIDPPVEFRDFFKGDYEDVMEITRTISAIKALESGDDRDD